MSSSSQNSNAQPQNSQSSDASPVNWGFALVAAFALGLALGFFGRPGLIADVPVQVVVTVIPDNSSKAVAQTDSSPAGSTDNTSTSHPAAPMSETGDATAPEPAQDDAAAPDNQATPTIMEFVMSDARHVEGEADAPVTIVEFSDFK
jgi:protein-disulfide isomerase